MLCGVQLQVGSTCHFSFEISSSTNDGYVVEQVVSMQ